MEKSKTKTTEEIELDYSEFDSLWDNGELQYDDLVITVAIAHDEPDDWEEKEYTIQEWYNVSLNGDDLDTFLHEKKGVAYEDITQEMIDSVCHGELEQEFYDYLLELFREDATEHFTDGFDPDDYCGYDPYDAWRDSQF